MKLQTNLLGFVIIPETVEEGFEIGKILVRMQDDPSVQCDGYCSLLINTEQLKRVDAELPWQDTGLGRIGFIKKLLEK